MDKSYISERLESAAKSGRYKSMGLYAEMVASADLNNLDAVGLLLKSWIASGSLRQADEMCRSYRDKLYENDHIAVAYFDLLALEERYGELFYHVWLCFNNDRLSEAFSYMESALSILDTLVTSKLIEAKAALSCQLEVELVDKIILSFSSDSKQLVMLAEVLKDEPRLFIEITELTRHICMGLHPTGIQRCLCEVIAAQERAGRRTSVFFFLPMEDCPASMSAADFLKVLNHPDGNQILKSIVAGDGSVCSLYGVQKMGVSAEDVVLLMDVFWTRPERRVAFLEACPCTKLLFVHDLIPMILDNEPAPNHIFAPSLRAISHQIDAFICNSNFTRTHVQHFLNFEGLNEKPCATVQLAAEIPTQFAIFEKATEGEFRTSLIVAGLENKNFILTVSSLSERKRIVELAQAFIDASYNIIDDWYLVIVGGDPGNNPILSEKLRSLCGVSNGRIIWLKGTSDRQLTTLYNSCRFAAYPSTFEGWGLPVGEALAYGKPVVAHRESSIPEVGGDQVYYCGTDHHSLTTALRQLMTDEKFYSDLARKILRPALRTWRNVVDDLAILTPRIK